MSLLSAKRISSWQRLSFSRGQRKRGLKKADPKYQNRYAFTSKIICGECDRTFKRHMNNTGSRSYPSWVCGNHMDGKDKCSMKGIKEDALQKTFILIMTRKEMLQSLLNDLRGETHKDSLKRLNTIDAQLEADEERLRTLTEIIAKGYLEPAVFTQEKNSIEAQMDSLMSEKERLIKSVNGDIKKTEGLNDLIRYVSKIDRFTEFDENAAGRFIDHITVHSGTEITFHLVCGLNLRERILHG